MKEKEKENREGTYGGDNERDCRRRNTNRGRVVLRTTDAQLPRVALEEGGGSIHE